MNVYGIIYLAINLVNGKFYVGQTINSLEVRKKKHKSQAFSNSKKPKFYFQKAILKHGFEQFEWYVLDTASDADELNTLEIFYIDKFNCLDSICGYNLYPGGDSCSGYKHTESTKIKMRKPKPAGFGQLMSLMLTGKKASAEYKRKRSIQYSGSGNPNFGKKHSKESIEKNLLSQKTRVSIICNETKQVFVSIREAARKLNMAHGNIRNQLKGKYKQIGGYTFSYVEKSNGKT